MTMLFSVKRGAELPTYDLTLDSTVDFNLAEATARELHYRHRESGTTGSIALTVVDATNKIVRLTPTTGLVATEGVYDCHVKLTFAGPKHMFIPQIGFDEFRVTPTI